MLISFFSLLGILIIGCSNQANSNDNKDGKEISKEENKPEFSLKFASTQPDGHPTAETQYKFKEIVEERSEGRIEVEVYTNGVLGDNVELNEAVQDGTVAITYGTTSYMGANFEPKYNVFELPFIIDESNIENAYELMDGEVGGKLSNALEKHGFKVLGYGRQGFRQLTNSKHPINSVEDLDGMDLRLQPNEIQLQAFRALGTNPSSLGFAELYSALQQGVIDAQENPVDIIYENNFYEVQEYLSLTSHVFAFTGFFMNNDLFNELPSDLQEIILEAGKETAQFQRELSASVESEYIDKLKEEMEVNEVSPENLLGFKEIMKPIYKDFLSNAEDQEIVEKVYNALDVPIQ